MVLTSQFSSGAKQPGANTKLLLNSHQVKPKIIAFPKNMLTVAVAAKTPITKYISYLPKMRREIWFSARPFLITIISHISISFWSPFLLATPKKIRKFKFSFIKSKRTHGMADIPMKG